MARTDPSWSVQVIEAVRSAPSAAVAVAERESSVPIITSVSDGCPLIVTVGPLPAIWRARAASSAAPERVWASSVEGRPESRRMSIISTGESWPSLPSSRAATPAAWGEAIDVPLIELYPVPGHVELIDTPGAEMSTLVLPRLLNEAKVPPELWAATLRMLAAS